VALTNAAREVAQLNTRRLQIPPAGIADFAGGKVCKNALKSPVLLCRDGIMAIEDWKLKIEGLRQLLEAEMVSKSARFKHVFLKK
jgi:hypothetical protein